MMPRVEYGGPSAGEPLQALSRTSELDDVFVGSSVQGVAMMGLMEYESPWSAIPGVKSSISGNAECS